MGASEVVSPDAAPFRAPGRRRRRDSRAPEGRATDTSVFHPPTAPEPGLVGEPPGAAMSAGSPHRHAPGLDIRPHGPQNLHALQRLQPRSCCA